MTPAPSAPSIIPVTTLALHYTVAMPQPATHFFEVSLTVEGWDEAVLDLKFPVWTPGSYLVREYARHLQGFTAQSGSGQPLLWQKVSKNHWQVQTQGHASLTLQYRILATELTVRTNHLDATHGYFNPAALCFRIPGYEKTAIAITLRPPPHWKVATPLPQIAPHTFQAASFDELVDSPFEIGTHACYDFEVLGKPHQFVIWGEGTVNVTQLLTDTQRIIETEAALFGGLPYDRYLFLLHLTANGYGGLEHRTSCSLVYSRFGLASEEGYHKFMSLVAHEFFHLWNVKRLRPKALETFDYDQENYTDALWFCEGTTSFYDLVIPLRAGLYNAQHYLKKVSEAITQLQTSPGRHVQSLSESSFDAWIKLYRPDAQSRNTQISYYLKGELVSFLLDLRIRAQHRNQRSLDDVMRRLWTTFGQPEIGFTRDQLKAAFESVAELDLTEFWHDYIEGTTELPFNDYLAPFGLELHSEVGDVPYIGFTVKTEAKTTLIKGVDRHSPAEQAGIEPGDELLAIAHYRVTADQLNERLQTYQPGESVPLTLFHHDQLRDCSVVLGKPQPQRFSILPVPRPTTAQQALLQQWLGIAFPSDPS